jgi:hypothetical protein
MALCYHQRMHHLRLTLRAVRVAQNLGGAWHEFISGLDMWERVAVACKVGVVIVAVIFMVTRPPASAQERQIPENPTPQVLATLAAIQEHDLAQLRADVATLQAKSDAKDLRIEALDKATDSLNTKWLCAMAVLGFLQSTGILVPLFKKKAGA